MWKSGRWPGMIGQRGAAYQHIYLSWQYLTHSEDLPPNQQHYPHLWIAVQWFEYILWHFYLDFCIHLKWHGGKSTEKSVFEKLEWEDFNNRWPPDCDSGHAPLIRIWCEADKAGLVMCVWGAISGQTLAIMTCNENKLLPDHQHSLTGSCSAFTTFIIRCLSLAHWSHEVHTSQCQPFARGICCPTLPGAS